MDTPITISSTVSSIEKPSKKITVLPSEPSIARVPVSWDSPVKSCDRESSCTPTTLQKVNSWINSLNRLNRDNVGSDRSHRQSSDFSDFEAQNGIGMEGEYNKSKLQNPMAEDELDNYYRSPYDYKNAKGSQSISKNHNNTIYGGGPNRCLHPKTIKRCRSLQIHNLEEKDDDQSDYDSDVPLSPESEKKKELCSYLQLMKPTDKKTVMILQNRRSVRVKNLSLMQEKRELERKLREAQAENTDVNGFDDHDHIETEQKYPGLKSFEEMNVDLDKKKYKWLKYSGTKASQDSFRFPKPTDNLSKSVTNFDEVKVSWFEKRKESSSRNQQDMQESQLKEKKEENKKKYSDVTHQENKHKQIEGSKQKLRSEIENNPFKKKKTEAVKNSCALEPKNAKIKVRQSNKYNTVKNINKPKAKVAEIDKKENDNNGFKKKKGGTSRKCRSQSRLDNSYFEKSKLQDSTTKAQLPVHLVQDINGLDAIIKRNRDLTKNNASSNVPVKGETNIEAKSKIIDSSNTATVPISPVKLGNESSKAEVITKVRKLKKKIEIKKLYAQKKIKRSSFKIKLIPKKRSLGSPGKRDKKLTRSKSPLISDIMKSLRNRNIETNSPEVNSINAARKGRKLMNKKENIKHKVGIFKKPEIKHKNSENNMEVVLKRPLKDTNENPVKNNNISNNPSKDLNHKITENKSPVNEKTPPKNNNLQNSISDIDFCSLSSEHKTSLFVIDKNQGDSKSHLPIIAIYHKNNTCNGLESPKSARKKFRKSEFYSQILNIEKYPEVESQASARQSLVVDEEIASKISEIKQYINENQTSLLRKTMENDFELHSSTSLSKEPLTPVSSKEKSDTTSEKMHKTQKDAIPFTSFKKNVGIKSLHKCLNITTQKSVQANLEIDTSPTSWSSESPSHKPKKNQHSINICKEHGSVLKAFYLEYNLILCQEFMVSFWTQTALGNVLGAQNMWIHKGSVQRMAMNNNCIFKESLEMVVSTENTVAYIELWTKEHQSEIREGPVADVFATVYFWKKGQNGLDKKVLQLENINGFADDVQYSVLKSTPKIIVSWHLACSELDNKKTYIHCYQLAADYQTVCNISEFEAVEHYVSSLHNIEGCDSLIMGCGENKITLWNIDYGYVVATIEMSEIKSPLSTLWVKCDRGFLFTLQQCVDRELRLIAIHGMNHSWKKLASYAPPDEYDRLKGVCVENGIVLAFYDKGILCWNAQTAETIVEESHNEAEYISGKYVISVVNDQVNIRHAIAHLLSAEDS